MFLLTWRFLYLYRVRSEELVTPFAQVLSCLQNIRSNFVLLTNVRQSR